MTERQGEAATDRVAILVSGMHRSGTSAMTRLISLLGASLPTDLIAGREGDNEPGFWESETVVDVNRSILEQAGSWWGGWQRVGADYLRQRDRASARMREFLQDQFGATDLILLKDPRLSRLMPFWTDVLNSEGYRCLHVIAVREPGAVVGSVDRRNGLNSRASVLGWLAHLLDAEEDTRGEPRVFLSFERLLEDWQREATRISDALKLTWPRSAADAAGDVEEFLQPRLAHPPEEPPTKGPVATIWPVYEVFARWCADREQEGDAELLDRWRAAFAPIRARRSPTALVTTGRRAAVRARRAEGDSQSEVLVDNKVWVPINNAALSAEAQGAFAWLQRELRWAGNRERNEGQRRRMRARIEKLESELERLQNERR